MTDNTQPEALRLADWLQAAVQTYPQMSEDEPGGYASEVDQIMDEAAAELRRQHARIVGLDAQLEAAGAASVLEDAARLERERICAAIKAEDDYCVDQGDYMLDSDDCIKIVRGEWVRPDFAIDTARKEAESHDKT